MQFLRALEAIAVPVMLAQALQREFAVDGDPVRIHHVLKEAAVEHRYLLAEAATAETDDGLERTRRTREEGVQQGVAESVIAHPPRPRQSAW